MVIAPWRGKNRTVCRRRSPSGSVSAGRPGRIAPSRSCRGDRTPATGRSGRSCTAAGRRSRAFGPSTLSPFGSSGQPFCLRAFATCRTASRSVSGSARPSITISSDGSVVLPVAMTHRPSAAMLRAFCVPSPATMCMAPSIQKAITGIRCGRPSGRVVASQQVLDGSGFPRRARATSQDVVSASSSISDWLRFGARSRAIAPSIEVPRCSYRTMVRRRPVACPFPGTAGNAMVVCAPSARDRG